MRRPDGFDWRRPTLSRVSPHTRALTEPLGGELLVGVRSAPRRLRFARAVALSFAICAAAGAIVWFIGRPPAPQGGQGITLSAAAKGPAPRLGALAPEFGVLSLDGEVIDTQSLRGHPIWITFWASWCPPCRAESPEIRAAFDRHAGSGLVILAIDVGEDEDAVKAYVEKAGLPFPVGLDRTTGVAAQYRVSGLPTHFFVDAEGVLREMRIGPMSTKEIERRLGSVLPSR